MSAVLMAPLGVIVFATIYWLALRPFQEQHQEQGDNHGNGTDRHCLGCGCGRGGCNQTEDAPSADRAGGF